MPFNLSLGDITNIKCDAIVNSLGVDASKYGKLCKNIVKKANSNELKLRLDIEKNGKIGSMFLTPGYELKAQKIIHVVSPFRKDDNETCDNLKKVYDDVIGFAIENSFKKIALPFLASGANGYSDEEVYKAAMASIGEILDKEDELKKDIIDITLVMYLKPRNKEIHAEYDYAYFRNENKCPGNLRRSLGSRWPTRLAVARERLPGSFLPRFGRSCTACSATLCRLRPVIAAPWPVGVSMPGSASGTERRTMPAASTPWCT